MKKRINFVCLIVALILVLSIPGFTAYAAEGPLTESYYYTSDPGKGPCSNIVSSLSSIGYNTRLRYDRTAEQVRSTMNDDAVFTIWSHARAGRIACAGGQYLSARITSSSENISLENKFAKTTLKLKKIRFAYYAGCNTANTDNTGDGLGNLTTYTSAALGAKSSMGFTKKIGIESQSVFGKKLFAELANGKTVSEAANLAAAYTLQVKGNYNGHNGYYIAGITSTKIKPAAYGNS